MTKKVVWTNTSRLACANVSPSPDVVLCLTDSALLAPLTCVDDSTYTPSTLDATLTKVWKSPVECSSTSWSYVFDYDESLLADPATALTSAQIGGVFCKGCLTTWVEDQVACLTQAETSGALKVLGKLEGANFNITTDQPFAIEVGPLGYWFNYYFLFANSSIVMANAIGGIYDGAGKTGNQFVSSGQSWAGYNPDDFSSQSTSGPRSQATTLYLSLTTPEGSAATGDIYIIGIAI